jgi:hypothetical protein
MILEKCAIKSADRQKGGCSHGQLRGKRRSGEAFELRFNGDFY